MSKIDVLALLLEDSLKADNPDSRIDPFDGHIYLTDQASGFDSFEEYKLLLDDLDIQKFEWINATFYIRGNQETHSNWILRCNVSSRDASRVDIELSKNKHAFLVQLFNSIERKFNDNKRLIHDPDAEKESNKLREVNRCIDVINNLPDYQTRIRNSFSNEKDVQDFLYPVLKSHFDDLVDEDYFPKIAGSSSKPDFAVPSADLIIECKYLRKHDDYKRFKKEISEDLVGYFGDRSPYKKMIILIYNASGHPAPANYIADMESIDEKIVKVFISPGMKPAKD